MSLQLYINSRRIDLYPGAKIAMSYSVNKVAEAIRPSGSYSNQLKVPKTQNNIDIVEAADSLNSDTNLPYLKLPCRLIQNGRELISDGFAILVQAQKDYEFVCYGGNLDFFDKIKDKKLSDLTKWHELDHLWDMATVVASRTRTDYKYPIIDWSKDGGYMNNTEAKVDARTLFPAVFESWLVDKIFEDADFNKSGLILSSPKYLSGMIPVQSIEIGDRTKAAHTVTITNTDAITYPAGLTNFIEADELVQQDSAWNLPTIFTGFTSKKGYEVKHDGNFKIDIKFDWTKTAGNASFNFKSLWTSSFFQFGKTINLVGASGSIDTTFTGSCSKSFFHTGTSQRRGDFLQFYLVNGSGAVTLSNLTITVTPVEWNNLVTFTSPSVGYSFNKVQYNLFSSTVSVPTGNNYSPKLFSWYDAIPDMTQSDFIKFIAQKYGIIFQTNSFTKTVEFKQFKEIYDNIPIAKDWSKKLHLNERKKPVTVKYHSDFAQENIFKWTNDTDRDVGSKLGEGKLLVADESLPKEKDLVALPFSGTEMVTRLIGRDVPIIKYLEIGVPKDSVKPRNLIVENEDFALRYTDTQTNTDITTGVPMARFILTSKSFNLGFNDSLIKDNYNEFSFFLDKYKAVITEYLLDENDIHELDFFIPIYDTYFKQYFFISKITNFVEGRPTQVELIRL